jgi:hypothetical protein
MTWMKTAAVSTERAATQKLGTDPSTVGPLQPAPPAAVAGAYGTGSRQEGWTRGDAPARAPLRTAVSWLVGLVSLLLLFRILLAAARLARGRPR